MFFSQSDFEKINGQSLLLSPEEASFLANEKIMRSDFFDDYRSTIEENEILKLIVDNFKLYLGEEKFNFLLGIDSKVKNEVL